MDYSHDKKLWIKKSEAQELLNYLVQKPYAEVFKLVDLIKSLAPREVKDEETQNEHSDK